MIHQWAAEVKQPVPLVQPRRVTFALVCDPVACFPHREIDQQQLGRDQSTDKTKGQRTKYRNEYADQPMGGPTRRIMGGDLPRKLSALFDECRRLAL